MYGPVSIAHRIGCSSAAYGIDCASTTFAMFAIYSYRMPKRTFARVADVLLPAPIVTDEVPSGS